MAAGLGFEPRLPDPESSVLPLDDPALFHTYKNSVAGVMIKYLYGTRQGR